VGLSGSDEECFTLDFQNYETMETQEADVFLVSLPTDPSTAKTSLTYQGSSLDQIVASPSPPTVTLTYPNGGETLSESSLVSWSGSDTDGDAPYYRLFYSADNGTTWSMLTSNITATTFIVDPGDLAGTETGLFKVAVSDGFHNAEDQSDGVFAVTRKAPTVSIDTSMSGASIPLSTTVMLSGFVIDHEDSSIPDTNYAWTSDIG
jgi:hypothetical protein